MAKKSEEELKQAKDKQEFGLHVSVIQFQDGLPLADARAKAWAEGRPGLRDRMGLDAVQEA